MLFLDVLLIDIRRSQPPPPPPLSTAEAASESEKRWIKEVDMWALYKPW